MAMLLDCLAVALGGAIGSVARYLLSLAPFKTVGEVGFPLATFVTNIAGAFVIGLVVAAVAANCGLDARATLLVKTGFCGGFTTFSTFALESAGLFDRGETLVAVAYVAGSCVLGILAVEAAQAVFAALAAGR